MRIPTESPWGDPNEESTEPLTARELEILRCLVRGATNQEIAKTLFRSPYTIGNHVRSIMRKLRAHTRTQAVVTAIELGILDREHLHS